jgi:hypothetical protein
VLQESHWSPNRAILCITGGVKLRTLLVERTAEYDGDYTRPGAMFQTVEAEEGKWLLERRSESRGRMCALSRERSVVGARPCWLQS